MSIFDIFGVAEQPVTYNDVHQAMVNAQPRHCQLCMEHLGGWHGFGHCVPIPLSEQRIREIVREEIKAALPLP